KKASTARGSGLVGKAVDKEMELRALKTPNTLQSTKIVTEGSASGAGNRKAPASVKGANIKKKIPAKRAAPEPEEFFKDIGPVGQANKKGSKAAKESTPGLKLVKKTETPASAPARTGIA